MTRRKCDIIKNKIEFFFFEHKVFRINSVTFIQFLHIVFIVVSFPMKNLHLIMHNARPCIP